MNANDQHWYRIKDLFDSLAAEVYHGANLRWVLMETPEDELRALAAILDRAARAREAR